MIRQPILQLAAMMAVTMTLPLQMTIKTIPQMKDGNIVCNDEGYIYNPETKMCEPPKEEEEDDTTPGSGVNTGTSGESFEDVLKRVVVAAPDVAPISANVRPMQEGGMAGLNRAADNFLKALAG